MAFLPPPPLRTPTRQKNPLSTPTMRTPITTSNPTILGGGPTGSVLLAHLHTRALPTTLFETTPNFSTFNITRAYALRFDFRAIRVLHSVPGLHDHLRHTLLPTQGFAASYATADGKIGGFEVPARAARTDLCDLRPAIVQALRGFVERLHGVEVRYGAELVDLRVAQDGLITLFVHTENGVIRRDTRLLLACDGRNSRVAELLQRAHARGDPVHAEHGFGVEESTSAAVGLCLKSIVINEKEINQILGERDPGKFVIRAVRGDASRSFHDVFRFSIFPASRSSIRAVGGLIGTIVQHEAHNIWKLRSVEEAYTFFERNFPQLDVRAAIAEVDMRRFVEAKPSRFGAIQRRRSLSMTTGVSGRGDGGAVVFLGDSAHAFPPDVGQGVCAAVQDVGVFMEVLDHAGEDAAVQDVVRRYDEIRRDEGKALMKLSQYASPYQYGVYPNRLKIWAANVVLRRFLSKVLPGFVWPQMAAMIPEDLTYREIVRRADVTTARLLGGAAAVTMAVVAAIVQTQLTG